MHDARACVSDHMLACEHRRRRALSQRLLEGEADELCALERAERAQRGRRELAGEEFYAIGGDEVLGRRAVQGTLHHCGV